MSEHYTKNTIEVSAWCGKCARFTQHRVDDGRKGPCLRCIERLGARQKLADPPAARQRELFG